MSTAAGAVVISRPGSPTCEAHIVTLGDSRILLVDKEGHLKKMTVLHNLGARISAGLEPEAPPEVALNYANALTRGIGSPEETPDQGMWTLEPGDRLVAATDGLGDARENEDMPPGVWHADRCAEDQARLVHASDSVGVAVASLVAYALDQMADFRGKPDNIGVAVLEVLPASKRSRSKR